jgi:hypothetical protein
MGAPPSPDMGGAPPPPPEMPPPPGVPSDERYKNIRQGIVSDERFKTLGEISDQRLKALEVLSAQTTLSDEVMKDIIFMDAPKVAVSDEETKVIEEEPEVTIEETITEVPLAQMIQQKTQTDEERDTARAMEDMRRLMGIPSSIPGTKKIKPLKVG